MMKMMLSSFVGHNMIDIGTQAMAGIGRNISETGKTISHQPETAHDEPERHRDRRGYGKADEDAPAAQKDVLQELVVARHPHQALEHHLGRGHVDEADVRRHPVFRE